jgi:hypothetical protein
MTNNIQSLGLKRVIEALEKGDRIQAERFIELVYTEGYCNGFASGKNVGLLPRKEEK